MLNFLIEKGGGKDVDRGPFPMIEAVCSHGQAPGRLHPHPRQGGTDPNAYNGATTARVSAIKLDPKVRKPEIARGYVKALIENKADVNLKDKREKLSPLQWAKKRGDQEIIHMLEKAGAQERSRAAGAEILRPNPGVGAIAQTGHE